MAMAIAIVAVADTIRGRLHRSAGRQAKLDDPVGEAHFRPSYFPYLLCEVEMWKRTPGIDRWISDG